MKILLTGGNGQLGQDCRSVLASRHEVASIDIEDVDIADPAGVEAEISRYQPEVIVNCAAFTRVDACETEKEAAVRVNADGPANLAASARRHSIRLVHISTDYVFDGKKPVPQAYTETDAVCPLSCYGRTKLAGEQSIAENTTDSIILRTAWLYGIHGQNFLSAVLKKVRRSPEQAVKVVNDQYGSPTWSRRLALQIKTLIEAEKQGIFHASSEGFCTWYELARYFLDQLGVGHRVVPCTTEEYPTPAVRPKNSILENRRLKQEGINVMVHWQADIDEYIRRYKNRLRT